MDPDIKFVAMHYFEFDGKPARAWNIVYHGETVGTLINQVVGTQGENSYCAMIDKFGDDRDGMHGLGTGHGNWFSEATKFVEDLLTRK